MIDKAKINEAHKLVEIFKKTFPAFDMSQKLKNASPEDKKKCEEIAKTLGHYLRNKDLEGALKYLNHIRAKL